MDYTTLASDDTVKRVSDALTAKGFLPQIVKDGAEALETIKTLIPAGASVMNGSSTTLQQIGFIDYLKSDDHKWNNLHANILAEKDPEKQAKLRKESVLSDYYLGSVHALSETGEMIIASNTGSQLPHIVFTSPNIIFVVSTQKITSSLETAFKRLEAHVIPLEDVRMNKAYGMGTTHSKTLILHQENPMMGRKVHVLLVNEKLGF
ncbi:MAG: hypothetical protein RI947_1469 [Candidatus Parcubacteria bacterium]|jgi:L-lactate utilization protein LutC